MKLKNLFWFATGASISYHLVKNRKEIKTEETESSQLVMGIQDNLAKIQRNLDIIQDQKTNLRKHPYLGLLLDLLGQVSVEIFYLLKVLSVMAKETLQ